MAEEKKIDISYYKLTNWDRDTIQKRALDAAFAKEESLIARREFDLCRRCYNHVIPPDVRRKIAALPEAWFRTDLKPCFNVGGLHVALNSNEPLRVPQRDEHGRIGVVKERELIDAVQKLLADKEDLSQRRAKAKAATKALLYSVTSSRKLLEAWPEAKPFLKDIGVAVQSAVPAQQVQELNVMLGLKKAA